MSGQVGQDRKAVFEDSLMNIEELSIYLGGKPVATIRCYCSRRQIPHIKIGHSVRFRKSDIDEWLEKGAVKVSAA